MKIDTNFINASSNLLGNRYCRHCLRPYVEEAAEREQQRRESQSEPSQIMTADLQAFRAHRQQRPHSTLVGLSPVRETAHEDRSALVKRCLYSHKLQKGENARNLSEALGGNPTKTKSISSSSSSSSKQPQCSIFALWWIGLESSVRSVKQSVRSVKESVRSVISTSKPECSICLQQYEEGETISWAKNEDCNHMYHEECIVEWLSKHDECPLCRTNLLEGDHDHE